MTSIRTLREAVHDFVGKIVGTRHEQPTLYVSQVKSIGNLGDIKALPHRYSKSIQVLTPGSSIGQFYFMAGFSQIGGPDPMP